MKNNHKVSIIIVTWNWIEDLKICLPSIKKQSFQDFEVCIIDNWSTDWTIEYVKKFDSKKYKIISMDSNYGFAIPNNIWYKNTHWKYVLTLNNDIELVENFLEEAVKYLDETSDMIYSINPKMLYYFERDKINTIWIWLLKNGNWYNLWKWDDANKRNEIREIYWASWWAAFYKRKVIDSLWYLFDWKYFAYLEDLDLAIRADKKWYKSMYLPNAICYHKHSNTSKRIPLKKIYLIERNRLRNIIKYNSLIDILLEPVYTVKIIFKWFSWSGTWKIDQKQKKTIFWNIFSIIYIMLKARVHVFLEIPELLRLRKNLLLKS